MNLTDFDLAQKAHKAIWELIAKNTENEKAGKPEDIREAAMHGCIACSIAASAAQTRSIRRCVLCPITAWRKEAEEVAAKNPNYLHTPCEGVEYSDPEVIPGIYGLWRKTSDKEIAQIAAKAIARMEWKYRPEYTGIFLYPPLQAVIRKYARSEHEQISFKIGDSVRITRTTTDEERISWNNTWLREMDKYVGQIGTIQHTNFRDEEYSVTFPDEHSFWFPVYVLKKVEAPDKTEPAKEKTLPESIQKEINTLRNPESRVRMTRITKEILDHVRQNYKLL